MTTYHPLATGIDKNGNEQKLLTYDGFSSLTECIKQFDLWQKEYGYKLSTACVQEITDGTVVEHYYENKWVPVGGN